MRGDVAKQSTIYGGFHQLVSENPLASISRELTITIKEKGLDPSIELEGIQQMLYETSGIGRIILLFNDEQFKLPDEEFAELLEFIDTNNMDTHVVCPSWGESQEQLLDSAYLIAFSHTSQGQVRQKCALGSFEGEGKHSKPRRSLRQSSGEARLSFDVQQDKQEQQQVEVNHSFDSESYKGDSFAREELERFTDAAAWDADPRLLDCSQRLEASLVRLKESMNVEVPVDLGSLWTMLFTGDTYRPAFDRIHISALQYMVDHVEHFVQGFHFTPMPEGFSQASVDGRAILRCDIEPEPSKRPLIPWSRQVYQCVVDQEQWEPPVTHTGFDFSTSDLIPAIYQETARAIFGDIPALLGEFYQQYGKEQTMALITAFHPHVDHQLFKVIFGRLPKQAAYYDQFRSQSSIDSICRFLVGPPVSGSESFTASLIAHAVCLKDLPGIIESMEAFYMKVKENDISLSSTTVMMGIALASDRKIYGLTHAPIFINQLCAIIDSILPHERTVVFEKFPDDIRPQSIKRYYWACHRYGYNLLTFEMDLRFEPNDEKIVPYQPTIDDMLSGDLMLNAQHGIPLFLRFLATQKNRLALIYYERLLFNAFSGGSYNNRLDLVYGLADDTIAQSVYQTVMEVPQQSTIQGFIARLVTMGVVAAASQRGNVNNDSIVTLADLCNRILKTDWNLSAERKIRRICSDLLHQIKTVPDFSIEYAVGFVSGKTNDPAMPERSRFYKQIIATVHEALSSEGYNVGAVGGGQGGDEHLQQEQAIRRFLSHDANMLIRMGAALAWRMLLKKAVVAGIYRLDCSRNHFPMAVESRFSDYLRKIIDRSKDMFSAIDALDDALNLHVTFLYLNHSMPDQLVKFFDAWWDHKDQLTLKSAKALLFLSSQSRKHGVMLFEEMIDDAIKDYVDFIEDLKKHIFLIESIESPGVLRQIIRMIKSGNDEAVGKLQMYMEQISQLNLPPHIQDDIILTVLASDGVGRHVHQANPFIKLLDDGINKAEAMDEKAFIHACCILMQQSALMKDPLQKVWKKIVRSKKLNEKKQLVILVDRMVLSGMMLGQDVPVDLITQLATNLWRLHGATLDAFYQLLAHQVSPGAHEVNQYLDVHPDGDGLVERLQRDPLLASVNPAVRLQLHQTDGIDRVLTEVSEYVPDDVQMSDQELYLLAEELHFINAIGHEYKFPYAGKEMAYQSLSELDEPSLKALLVSLREDFNDTNQLIYIAALGEVMFRMNGKMPYSTQVLTVLLARRNVKQNYLLGVATGEGKGISIALLAAFEWALGGRTITVSTANLILARRDHLEFSRFYEFIGANSSFICANSAARDYRLGGVHYTDTSNYSLFKAKMARDQLSLTHQGGVGFKPCFIGDELDDSLLDDRIRYNLSVSNDDGSGHGERGFQWVYEHINDFVQYELPTMTSISEQAHINACRAFLLSAATTDWQCSQLEDIENGLFITDDQMNTWIDTAIEVKKLVLGNDFVVTQETAPNGAVYLMAYLRIRNQKNTSARISHGGHQLLHAHLQQLKKRGKLSGYTIADPDFLMEPESHFVSSENSKNVIDFHLQSGGRAIGITGTVGNEDERLEMVRHYGFKIFRLPTYRPKRGEQYKDQFALSYEAQVDLIGASILKASGRPVIIFARDPLEAKRFHDDLHTKDYGLVPVTFHLVQSEDEMDVDAYGKANAVTISTPMLGRGTDIKPEHMEGLHVVETYVASFRESMQMTGRTARNGAKGSYQRVLNAADLASRYGISLPKKAKRKALHYDRRRDRLQLVKQVGLIQRRIDTENAIERRYLQKSGDKKYEIISLFDTAIQYSKAHQHLPEGPESDRMVDEAKKMLIKDLELLWLQLISDSDPNGELANPYIRYDEESGSHDTARLDNIFFTFCVKAETNLYNLLEKSFAGYKMPVSERFEEDEIPLVADDVHRTPVQRTLRPSVPKVYAARFNIKTDTQHEYEQRVVCINQLNGVHVSGFRGRGMKQYRLALASLIDQYQDDKVDLMVESQSVQALKIEFASEALKHYPHANATFHFKDFYHIVMKPLRLSFRDLDLALLKDAVCKELKYYHDHAFWVGYDRVAQVKVLIQEDGEIQGANDVDALLQVLQKHHQRSVDTDKGLFRRSEKNHSRFRGILGNFMSMVQDQDESCAGVLMQYKQTNFQALYLEHLGCSHGKDGYARESRFFSKRGALSKARKLGQVFSMDLEPLHLTAADLPGGMKEKVEDYDGFNQNMAYVKVMMEVFGADMQQEQSVFGNMLRECVADLSLMTFDECREVLHPRGDEHSHGV